jgi:hypothetical protein
MQGEISGRFLRRVVQNASFFLLVCDLSKGEKRADWDYLRSETIQV